MIFNKLTKPKLQDVLIFVLIAAVAGFVYFHFFDQGQLDRRYQESKEFIQEKEDEIAAKKEKIKALQKTRQELQTHKQDQVKKIKELTDQLAQVPPPEKVETVKIKEIEYVPLVQYRTLYQLDQALQAALYKYLAIDEKETVTTDQLITKLEDIDDIRQQEIDRLIKDRDYFYHKAKQKWVFGWGVAVGVDPVEVIDMLLARQQERSKPIRITVCLFFGRKIN